MRTAAIRDAEVVYSGRVSNSHELLGRQRTEMRTDIDDTFERPQRHALKVSAGPPLEVDVSL